jgi:hypothetical protein
MAVGSPSRALCTKIKGAPNELQAHQVVKGSVISLLHGVQSGIFWRLQVSVCFAVADEGPALSLPASLESVSAGESVGFLIQANLR